MMNKPEHDAEDIDFDNLPDPTPPDPTPVFVPPGDDS